MKTKIRQEFHHSIILNESDIKFLHHLISDKYEQAEISLFCIDGSELSTNHIEEVIAFENSNYRKINKLRYYANSKLREEELLLDISSLFWDTSAELNIISLDDQKALFLMTEITNKLKDSKTPYDLFVRYSASTMLGFAILFCLLLLAVLRLLGIIMPNKEIMHNLTTADSFLMFVFGVVTTLGIIGFFDKTQRKLFPKVIILIGKQKEEWDRLSKRRSFIFVVVLIGILVSIISNLISGYIIK